ncbi:MAG: zinc ribbon domain-containing protein [Bacillota bacterium]
MTLFFFIIVAIGIYYFLIYKDRSKSRIFVNKEKRCPNCKNIVKESFNVCPICKETLKRKCDSCSERINVEWKYCPYCEEPTKKV